MSDRKHLSLFFVFFGGLVVAVVACIGTSFAYEKTYAGRVFPGVRALGVSLGGMTIEEATRALESAWKTTLSNGLRLSFENTVYPIANGETLAKEYVHLQTTAIIEEALARGRSGNQGQRALDMAHLLLSGETIPTRYELKHEALETSIRSTTKSLEVPSKNASLVFAKNNWQAFIEPESNGRTNDLPTVINAIRDHLNALDLREPIPMVARVLEPNIRTEDLKPLVSEANILASHANIRLKMEDMSWTFSQPQTLAWIIPTSTRGTWKLVLDEPKLTEDLNPFIDPFLKTPKNGYMKVEDGVLKEFTAPVEGIKFDAHTTGDDVLRAWKTGSSTVNIVLTKDIPKILGDGESLGIRQVLGVGRSNFSGSPTNRRKNIALGAKKVHGTLLAPNQEFSMLTTLGVIDDTNGWLPELVIKGNKTTPEFGGGLCQIGTTMFRAAMRAGLPITERQNHSYRVRYYEPAGTDATIYDPKPDFRFRNDTGNWMLVTTQATKNDLAFTVWGTDDGRTVDLAEPRIYNIVPPPEKKVIESTDIPAGTEKCTETAHAGADASLTYIVNYPGKDPVKTIFNSHYKPWGAVCLKGVAELSTTSSTQPIIDETGPNNPR